MFYIHTAFVQRLSQHVHQNTQDDEATKALNELQGIWGVGLTTARPGRAIPMTHCCCFVDLWIYMDILWMFYGLIVDWLWIGYMWWLIMDLFVALDMFKYIINVRCSTNKKRDLTTDYTLNLKPSKVGDESRYWMYTGRQINKCCPQNSPTTFGSSHPHVRTRVSLFLFCANQVAKVDSPFKLS